MKKYTLVGTGMRGIQSYIRPLIKDFTDCAELCAVYDINHSRALAAIKMEKAENVKVYSDFADRLKVFVSTGCAGAIYTQTTDVEGEINGIMTYDRDVVKFNEEALRAINVKVIESLE